MNNYRFLYNYRLSIVFSIQFLAIILSLIIPLKSLAETMPKKDTVNIITWWGYLEPPTIANEIQKQCHVNISFDTYYSNNEFLKRFEVNKNNYDIIIFSNTIYNLIKNQIPKSTANLSLNAYHFNPIIKKHYFDSHYPKNIIYFLHALVGFLWNPNIIALDKKDDIHTIFKNVGNNIVIMIDDPIEVWNLVNRKNNDEKFVWSKGYGIASPLTQQSFNQLIQNSKTYITNNDNQIYNQPNFAFAFEWSGDAIIRIKKSRLPYKFLVHPKLSYISTDLLAAMNNNPNTACVAKALSSKKILDILQENSYYISPYGDFNKVNDMTYQSIYKPVFSQLQKISWLKPVSASDYKKISNTWSEIQLNSPINK